MDLLINGETHTIPDATTAQGLLEILELTQRRLAMEVNQEILPRSQFEAHRLQPGDRVEIIHAIGGG